MVDLKRRMIVLVAIFAGFQLNGIVGALLAVPIAGVIQVVVRYWLRVSSEPDARYACARNAGN